VSGKTDGKITKMVESFHPSTLLVLLNAIYFKGEWASKFDEEATKEQPFTRLGGDVHPHPMMRQSGTFAYYEDTQLQAVRLPYGGGRLGMYVFLPAKSSSLAGFLGNLDAATWARYVSQLSSKQGEIVLPRFKLEYETELNDALCALGMAVAFDAAADFSEMISPPAYISLVKHKAYVEVNEAGTEAAAATMVVMVRSISQPFRMVVDRPFFFAICDDHFEPGAVLFMGVVADP
jgi:serpin B